jgi:hypothetical protein
MEQHNRPKMNPDAFFLAGGGEMGALMRSQDWSKTPLGPVESWSPTLQTTVRTLLVNRFPLLLWWGPLYVQLYNDAYRPIPGAKHPRSLGQPARECWPVHRASPGGAGDDGRPVERRGRRAGRARRPPPVAASSSWKIIGMPRSAWR